MFSILPRSLRGLLLVNQGALVALVVATGALGAVWANHWRSSSLEAVRVNALLQQAAELRGDMYRQVQEVVRARLTENPDALNVYARYKGRIGAHFEQLSSLASDEKEALAIDYLRQTYDVVREDMDKVFTNPYLASDGVRMKLLDPAYEEWMLGDFESALSVFSEVVAVRQRTLEASVSRWNRTATALLPVPIALALILLFVAWRGLRRRFIEPMTGLVDGVRKYSQGDLDHRLSPSGVSESRSLAASFNEMARELAASRDALVEIEKQAALGQLVPVVAHNIRNPLASIRATAQLIDVSGDVDELPETRDAIIDSVDRLERWVSALLDYLNPLEPRLEPNDLASVADGALELLGPRLRDKQINVARHGWKASPACALDADLTEQALYGLLNNAVEASRHGSSIALRVETSAGRAALHIDDEGPGIGFEPRPDDLTPGPTTKPMGTGLGIPFAFKVFQAHGGEVRVGRRPERGTRATVLVPLAGEALEPRVTE